MRSKAAGLALKVLEDNFPKQSGKMRDFYGWSDDGDAEHDLLKSVRALLYALKGGALSEDDSLINAKMKQLGGDACLPHYHEAIQELRHDLFFLHLSITDMKLWNIESAFF